RPWRGIVPSTHLAREGRMTVTFGRRELLVALGGAAAAWPLAARAQQPERGRGNGVLMAFAESDHEAQCWIAAFPQELGKLGWTEGRNIEIDTRWATADGRFAKELVALQPDMILTSSTPAIGAMLQQTRIIPIIFVWVADPVGSGFGREPAAAGRQRDWFHSYRGLAGWQVGRATEGGRAARRQGDLAVQPGNGEICRRLPEPLQSRRCVPRRGSDRRTHSQQVRARIRCCHTGTRSE